MSRQAAVLLQLALLLPVSSSAQDFPLTARVLHDRLPKNWSRSLGLYVYGSERGGYDNVIHTFESNQIPTFSVWEVASRGRGYRITPNGVGYEGWVDADHVQLDLETPANPSPAYLAIIQAAFEKRVADTTVTGCGVYLGETITEGMGRLFPGNVTYIFRQRADAVEIYLERTRKWIPRTQIAVYPLKDGSPSKKFKNTPSSTWGSAECQESYRRPWRKAVALRDGKFYRAAGTTFPVVDFFKQGEVFRVTHAISTAWFTDGNDRWFSADDVVLLAFPAIARAREELVVRSGPGVQHSRVAAVGGGARLGLFAYTDGWYRLTPDGFPRSGWASLDQLTVEAAGVARESVPTAYLDALRPPPTQRTAGRQRSGGGDRRPPRLSTASCFTQGCLVPLLLVLVPAGFVFTLGKFLMRDSVPQKWYGIAYLIIVPLWIFTGPVGGVLTLLLLLCIVGYWLWRGYIYVQYSLQSSRPATKGAPTMKRPQQVYDVDEQRLLEIKDPDELTTQLEGSSLAMPRKLAILYHLDRTRAVAFAAAQRAETDAIKAAMERYLVYQEAQDIEQTAATEKARRRRDAEVAELAAGFEMEIAKKKTQNELELLDLDHEINKAEREARLAALRNQKAGPPKPRNPVEEFKKRLQTIQGGNAANEARAEAVERKKEIDEDPLVEDKERAKAQVDDELERFLDWLRRRG